jgi:hypothetical protein
MLDYEERGGCRISYNDTGEEPNPGVSCSHFIKSNKGKEIYS